VLCLGGYLGIDPDVWSATPAPTSTAKKKLNETSVDWCVKFGIVDY
jgi:hypothetical protein